MSGNVIKRLGELKIDGYFEGQNNNWVVYKPLQNSKQHSSGIDGDIVLSATPSIEIVDADLDVPLPNENIYGYSIGTDNKLKVAFDKNLYTDKASAINSLRCVSVTYSTGNLIPNGNLYVLVVKNSLGEEIHRTTPIPLSQTQLVISTFDDTRATDYDGYLDFVITRDYRST